MQQQFITVEQVKIYILSNVFDTLVELHGAVKFSRNTRSKDLFSYLRTITTQKYSLYYISRATRPNVHVKIIYVVFAFEVNKI